MQHRGPEKLRFGFFWGFFTAFSMMYSKLQYSVLAGFSLTFMAFSNYFFIKRVIKVVTYGYNGLPYFVAVVRLSPCIEALSQAALGRRKMLVCANVGMRHCIKCLESSSRN